MNISRKCSPQTIVKGLLITSVIYFHATMFMNLPNPAASLSQFNILLTLFPFLMMVFFFYAGYNYVPGKRSIGENIKRRSLQLLIPMAVSFVVSTLLIIAIRVPNGESWEGIKNGILYSLMSEPLALMIGFPASGVSCFDMVLALGILWFLYALYIVSIFFYLMVDYVIKNPARLFSVIFGLLLVAFCLGHFVGVYLPYTVQCYPVILSMMLLAAYLKKFDFLDHKIETKKDLALTIVNALVAEAIITGIGLFGYYRYGITMMGSLPGGKFDEYVRGFDAFISFVIGFLGTYAIHHASRLLCLIPYVSNALEWYGSHSSYVYLAHPILLSFVHTVMFKQQKVLGDFQPYAYSFIVIGLFIVIFIVVDLIIYEIKKKKNPPTEENA